MKITKAQLKRIIKEEVNTLLKERDPVHEAPDIYHQALAHRAAVDPPRRSMRGLKREPEKEKEEDENLKDYYDALRQRTKHDDLTENIENLTVENMLMAIEALSQMAVTIGIPVGLSGMVFNKLRKYIASKNETPI
jgi:uncharacterized protein (UPF0335 family)